MEVKLQLSVFALLIQVSLAVLQRVTVMKGQTLNLSCPLTNAHKTTVEWKNPEAYTMFFDHVQALRDRRYRINNLSESQFSISVSNITFKDGGNYTCTHYDELTIEKRVEVTVLGLPKITMAKHDGTFVVKCTAEANHHPPQIFWKFDHGPEILGHAQVQHEDKKYVSEDLIHLHSVKNRVTVKCLVRHPALHSKQLMNFVKIGRHTTSPRTTTTSSPVTQPQSSTEGQRTTAGWFRHRTTTVYFVNTPISETSKKLSTVPSNQQQTVTSPTGLFTDNSTASVQSGSTRRHDTVSNATATTDWMSVSETTEEITSYNHTEGNTTGSSNDPKMRTGSEGSSSLLVFLVTFLIFCLLVVVIFFAIKLRRAHIIWKRENEDSVPSEDSSKSKSSQEDRINQGQRRRGLFNTAFTQYVTEKPPVITSVINPAAMAATESVNKELTPQPQTPGQTSAKCDIKETEL